MNTAAQEMNVATQDMRDYAFYSTGLVGIGTVLLLITLWLTWQANRAAVAAVEVTRDIGMKQVRAYIGVKAMKCEWERPGDKLTLTLSVKNSGQTPAYGVSMRQTIAFGPKPLNESLSVMDDGLTNGGELGASHEYHWPYASQIVMSQELIDGIEKGTHAIWFSGLITYKDVWGKRRETRIRLSMGSAEQLRFKQMGADDEGNSAT